MRHERAPPPLAATLYQRAIMLRFRKNQIVLIADIRQMFRQILIDPSQRDLLRILWKAKKEEEPVAYRLKTVTYGQFMCTFSRNKSLKANGYGRS
ncbi:hypothetical protein AVEN_159880-1 [Araneus ventricosus]|uniref:Reverse transcriptase domain-containing protein n=1 Tax=Araneus ventricosus TaxID=182803 RepID=A0A4Y2E4H0_ARAVE|nr:hypothetical protein AVEN_159880-1 [Araneus ventricosus]